jgi:hypothetical protein
MKFFSVLALSGLTAAQVQTLVGVVNQVGESVQALDKAVKGFNGPSDVQSLQAASDKVGSTVSSGVETVKGASTITLVDSVTIQGGVQNLQATVETVVNDLISKKSTLVAANAGGQVEKSLQDQLTGAKALQAAIAGKVPTEVQSLATQLSQGINTALQKGIDAFQGTGSAAPASGSSGSAPSSPKSNNAASAAAPPPSKASSSVATSVRAKPATYTGGASRNVAGSLVGAAALFAVAL